MVESIKKKYLLFPKLHLKHLLFLFFFLISCIKKSIQIYFEQSHKISIDFIKLYIYDLGDFLSIIPLLIIKYRMRNIKKYENENEKNTNENQSIKSMLNNYFIKGKKKKKCDLYRNIFFLTIVDFIAQISSEIFYIITNEQKSVVKHANLNSTLIFNVIATLVFSYFFLHTKIYKHHIFALIIDIIFLIFLAVIDFIKIDGEDNPTISIIYVSVKILGGILYSLENVIAKIIFICNYFSAYALLLSKSIIEFFYIIIFSFPFFFIKLLDDDGELKLVFSMIAKLFEDKIYYLIFTIYMITSFFYNNFCMKIIEVFSPNHYVIAQILENVGIFIIDLIVYGPDGVENLVIRIIMYILLIFSTFIYNEFLVINICGLSKNTKLFLEYEEEYDIFTSGLYENDEDNNTEVIELNAYILQKDLFQKEDTLIEKD